MRPVLRFEEAAFLAAELSESSSVPDLLGEKILQNSLSFQLEEEDEIYEGFGRLPNAFPYRQQNCYNRELRERPMRTAVLENDYLRAVFLPERGGRLWSLQDKSAGRNLLYTNDVLQYSNLAVCNAWFSGGVEWNLGVIGHTPFTARPLYTASLVDESGNPVLRMYEYERIRKVTYQMDFWLEEESRFLNCRMRIVNENPDVIPMYWWSNIAVPEYEGGRVIVPAREAFTNGKGAVYKVPIPEVDGVDVTDYRNIEKSVDYFFHLPEKEPKFVANVDRDGYGLLQYSTDRLRGRKLFSWGKSEGSDHWQEFLTKDAGRYVEIQAGLAKTQYGCIAMPPHTAWEWMEQYGAVQLTKKPEALSHEGRWQEITEHVLSGEVMGALDRKLKATKKMALTKAQTLVQAGSGYGALADRGGGTAHLTFTVDEVSGEAFGETASRCAGQESCERERESYRRWQQFRTTGKLPGKGPLERPDEFLTEDWVYPLLKKASVTQPENWYVFYQLGIACLVRGKDKKAAGYLMESLAIEPNPWSYHALACLEWNTKHGGRAALYMEKGISYLQEDVSYLKEGFKILSLCAAYDRIRAVYEKLPISMQKVSRLKLYYIQALQELSESERAMELLEEGGGLLLEDVREGEVSLGQLYCRIWEALTGEKTKPPYRYQFRAV